MGAGMTATLKLCANQSAWRSPGCLNTKRRSSSHGSSITSSRHAGIAGVLAAGVAPAVHAQAATLRWRLASSFPKSLDTIYRRRRCLLGARKSSAMSGGKFVSVGARRLAN
jgi:TRAP-type mannitol/chloroaromatic compound transport system substrate-binding protein